MLIPLFLIQNEGIQGFSLHGLWAVSIWSLPREGSGSRRCRVDFNAMLRWCFLVRVHVFDCFQHGSSWISELVQLDWISSIYQIDTKVTVVVSVLVWCGGGPDRLHGQMLFVLQFNSVWSKPLPGSTKWRRHWLWLISCNIFSYGTTKKLMLLNFHVLVFGLRHLSLFFSLLSLSSPGYFLV